MTLNPIQPTPEFKLNASFKKGYISLQDEEKRKFYTQIIHQPSEINDFVIQYGKSVTGFGLFPSLFCPMRLQGAGFVKDFFSPSLMNFALKVNPIALRILATLGAAVLDILTLLPRMIGTVFRADYLKNNHPKIHPLIDLIKKIPDGRYALKSGKVSIKIRGEYIRDRKGILKKIIIKETFHIAIKQLHGNSYSWEKKIDETPISQIIK